LRHLKKTGSWFTGTAEGNFHVTPDDPSKLSYTGLPGTQLGGS
jgi:hypothetical protein